jgi:sorting nexin-9/18/33
VQALYDFSGEPGTAELSITAGEVLTVTRQNVGEGWWEGVNHAGQTGLFPAAYVEVRLCVCKHLFKSSYMHW